MSLSLMSINARGLKNSVKRKALFLFAKKNKTDFCFFQECHSTANDCSFWRSQWGDNIWLAHGSEHSAGVGIFRYNFNGNIQNTDLDSSGHFLIMVITKNNHTILIINIYGYNTSVENNMLLDTLEDKILEDKISHWLNKYPHASLVVGGDFNIAMNNMLDRWPPRRSGSPNSVLKCLMDKFDLVDVWREQFPNDRQYTWSNKDCSRQSRIDYWLVSRCLTKNRISVNISNTPLTDHKAIYLSIALSSDQSSGPKASFLET